MKKLMLRFVAAFALYSLVACGGSNPTGPSNTDFSSAGSGNVATSETTPPPAPVADAPEDTSVAIIVKDNGVVVNNTSTTLTACLFDAPYGEGQLVEEWRAKPGRTSMTFTNDSCSPSVGQIDIIDADSCPSSPHGLEPIAANPNVEIPNGLGVEAQEWSEWTMSLEGRWSQCEPAELGDSKVSVFECTGTQQRNNTFERTRTWQCSDQIDTETVVRPEIQNCSIEPATKAVFNVRDLDRGYLDYYRVVVDDVVIFEGRGRDYDYEPIYDAFEVKVYKKGVFGWYLRAEADGSSCGFQTDVLPDDPSADVMSSCRASIRVDCMQYCPWPERETR